MRSGMRNTLIVVAVLGLAAAIKLGFIDGRRVEATAYNAVGAVRRGAEQVTGAMPSGGDAIGGGERHTDPKCVSQCRANLANIDSAKKRVVRATGYSTGAVARSAVEREMGGRIPECPCGGTYTLGNEQQYPACSRMPGG